jgi:hypothetical protein
MDESSIITSGTTNYLELAKEIQLENMAIEVIYYGA